MNPSPRATSMDSRSSPKFDSLFRPQGIAVFGSVKKGKIAHQLITQLSEGRFPGWIAAVNPKAESPDGYPSITAYTSPDSVPQSPDLALIAVPAQYVESVVESCGAAGIPYAVVFTSGFSEIGRNEEEKKLKAAADRNGVRLIGPNCAGIMNTSAGLFASIELRALPGKTAFITQSGAVGGAVLALAEIRGIGFSKFVSYGNRVDIGEVELLDYLEADPETEVISLYLESLQNGREFMKAVDRATRRKPVLIIKAGRSAAGLRAASSHTGSLAGSDEIFAAMIKQTGALRVPGIEEMLDLCDGLCSLPRLAGKRIAVVTNSGGPGILTSDRGEELGLEIGECSTALREQLGEFLPAHSALANPIDLTVEGTGDGYSRTLQTVLVRDYDAAVAINVATPFLDSVALADGIIEASDNLESPKPVIPVFMAGRIVTEGIERLRGAGFPVLPTGERAAFVLSKMWEYSSRERSTDRISTRLSIDEQPLPLKAPLLEPEAVAFLQAEGFSFPDNAFVNDPAQLANAVEKIGFPLVMKVVSPQILHKSDVGGVTLDLKTPAEAKSAFTSMSGRFASRDFRGVMLYKQVQGGLEVIAGVSRDPTFGAVVLVGAGGVLTELLRDSALRVAPFDEAEALSMLAELKIDSLLSGYRGGETLDRKALADLLVRLSHLAARYPEIRELDLNPIFVHQRGLQVGDVRILAG